jgi:hypothetical protein
VTKTKGQEHRDKIRKRFFSGEDAWTGDNEKGLVLRSTHASLDSELGRVKESQR